jgi:hypothetical protein
MGGIKNLAILLARAFQNVLWGEKEVWNEPCGPMRKGNDVAVSLLLVHHVHDPRELVVD